MAGGKNKIHEHPNAGTSTFADRPQDINRKGRPRKTYAKIVEFYKDKGYTIPTRDDYRDFIGISLTMTEEDLQTFMNDKDSPQWARMLLQDMSDPKKRLVIMSDYRDWLFGRATQKIDGAIQVEPITVNINNRWKPDGDD